MVFCKVRERKNFWPGRDERGKAGYVLSSLTASGGRLTRSMGSSQGLRLAARARWLAETPIVAWGFVGRAHRPRSWGNRCAQSGREGGREGVRTSLNCGCVDSRPVPPKSSKSNDQTIKRSTPPPPQHTTHNAHTFDTPL